MSETNEDIVDPYNEDNIDDAVTDSDPGVKND